jgi:hypothetical protein
VIAVLLTLAGIALPSALAVAPVRRWIAPVPGRIALLFFLATLAFLHGAVFTSKMPVPIDEASRGDPYRGVVGDVVPYTRVLEGTGEIDAEVIRVLRPDHPLLDFLGVRFLLAEPEAAFGGKWRLVYRGADGALFENSQAKPRFFAAEAEVEVTQRSTADFTLRIRARRAVTVLSSEPAAPGWQIRVGERRVPVRVVEGAFVGFDVPAGESRVSVRYRPRAFYGGLLGMVAGLGLLLLTRRAPRPAS